ncbi:MAG: M15 family metallopeptidase [Bacteroidales bacterium]|nr:M15 family metallopeptidase [Bacteroidales bacterium]
MKRILVLLYIICAVMLEAAGQDMLKAAAPTKEFLLGKTHFEQDTNFMQIPSAYTVLRNPNNFIQKRTFEAYLKMWKAAKADGIRLVATSASRNFWVQRYIWEQKWRKTTAHQGAARAKYILQYNSMCGTSRHHWGTELDFNSPKLEYWNSVEGKKVYQWLCENAHKYGFYQPYTKKGGEGGRETGYNEEKWHWSYFPLANVYVEKYRELIKEEDLKGFLGEKHVSDLNIIEHYVFGVATPPEA